MLWSRDFAHDYLVKGQSGYKVKFSKFDTIGVVTTKFHNLGYKSLVSQNFGWFSTINPN